MSYSTHLSLGVNWVPFKDIAPPPPPPMSMRGGRGDRGRRREGPGSRSSSSYRSVPGGMRRGRGRGYAARGSVGNYAESAIPYVNYMPYIVPLEGDELKEAILK